MMPAVKKAFDLMGVDIVELSTENERLKNKTSVYDERWLEESKSKLLCDVKQMDCEKKTKHCYTMNEKPIENMIKQNTNVS